MAAIGTTKLACYTDESGNTGNDLFHGEQAWFLTGTLLTESALESERPGLEALLRDRGLERLHAKNLGFKGLEPYAAFLAQLVVLHRCRFIFTRTEKRHYCTMKFIDTLLDSGLNRAVSPYHHALAGMRTMMSMSLVTLMSPRIQEEFWPAYLKSEPTGFVSSLRRMRWNVQQRLADPRGKQLLLDALDYAIAHPVDLLDCSDPVLATPNVIAVTQILHSLNHLFGATETKIARFIHDRQNQVASGLKLIHGHLKKVKFKENPMLFLQDFEGSDLHECDIEVSEDPLVGLQVVDVVLWLFRRSMKGDLVEGSCDALLEEVRGRAVFREMSVEQFWADAAQTMTMVNRGPAPLTADQVDSAKKKVLDVEAKRLERMKTQD